MSQFLLCKGLQVGFSAIATYITYPIFTAFIEMKMVYGFWLFLLANGAFSVTILRFNALFCNFSLNMAAYLALPTQEIRGYIGGSYSKELFCSRFDLLTGTALLLRDRIGYSVFHMSTSNDDIILHFTINPHFEQLEEVSTWGK